AAGRRLGPAPVPQLRLRELLPGRALRRGYRPRRARGPGAAPAHAHSEGPPGLQGAGLARPDVRLRRRPRGVATLPPLLRAAARPGADIAGLRPAQRRRGPVGDLAAA